MLHLLIAAYLQFVIMLVELKKRFGMKRNCLCSTNTTVCQNGPTKMYDLGLLCIYYIINK